jgi:integrase
MKLDTKTVATLDLPDGKTDVIHFDNAMPGFGYRLRRGACGKVLRSWVAQYRRAGATRRVMIGNASIISAEQARIAAKKVLAAVALGQDPSTERADRRGRDALTMRSQVAEFLATKEPELAARSFIETKRYLTDSRYFGPLHSMPTDAITRKDVAARTVAIARECGAPTASCARSALGSFFTWTTKMGLIDSNPTVGAHAPAASKPRERVLTDQELAAVWRECGDDDHGRIVRLLILTACRRAEIGDMTWDEIDVDRGTFTIPSGRSKNGRAHVLPLLPMALDVIKAVQRMATRPQLFGRHSHGYTTWAKAKIGLDARLRDAVAPFVIHDIRRSAATGMANLGTQPHLIECILNHQGGFRSGVAATYNKSPYAREMTAALMMWEDHVRTLVEGGERKVVPFLTPAS